MTDLIIKGAGSITDGLYIIKDGEIFKYKSKGGTVRTYPIADRSEWIPCAERMPDPDECPIDCIVTRKGKFGNYVDMAVAEKDGTWSSEDWKAIIMDDGKSDKKTWITNTHNDGIIAWMPNPKPYGERSE